jgi:putative membrane protein
MKTLLLNIATLSLIVSLVACGPKKNEDSKEVAEDQNEQKFDKSKIEDDTEFAVKIADAGMLEVKLGELAQTNGYASEVKSFGKMMIEDHSKAGDELKSVAAQKNISLPTELSAKSQDKYNDLSKKNGKDFDDAYTDAMVSGHKDVLDLMKKEAEKGNDADLKSWATGKVAVIEHHLEMAKQAEEVVDKMKK